MVTSRKQVHRGLSWPSRLESAHQIPAGAWAPHRLRCKRITLQRSQRLWTEGRGIFGQVQEQRTWPRFHFHRWVCCVPTSWWAALRRCPDIDRLLLSVYGRPICTVWWSCEQPHLWYIGAFIITCSLVLLQIESSVEKFRPLTPSWLEFGLRNPALPFSLRQQSV